MQQVLLVVLGVRLGARFGQPVVGADEGREQFPAVLEYRRFVFSRAFDQSRKIADELPEAHVIFHGECRAQIEL